MVGTEQTSHTDPLSGSVVAVLLPHNSLVTGTSNSAMASDDRSGASSLGALVLQPSLPVATGVAERHD